MNCRNFLCTSTSYLPYILFILTMGLVPILYTPYADFVKYAIFVGAPIYLCCHQSKKEFLAECRELWLFLKPWSIWLFGIFIVILVHGVSGNSALLNAFALMCLLFLVLLPITITREQVLWGISINVIVFSVLILFDVCLNGLTSFVIGLNKNRIIPELTILGCICFTAYVFERKTYSKKLRNALLVSCFCLVLTVVITEVRTALLGIFAIAPLLLLYRDSIGKKILLKFLIVAIVAIALFWMTGRWQEGLVDLAKFEAGNSNSSWGLRIEFWKLATAGFLEKPVLGWGYKPFEELIASGLTFPLPQITKIPHFHSDYFTQLVSYGLVGITTWLTTLALLYKASKQDPVRVIILLSTLAMGLSDRIWHYNSTSILVILFCWVFLSLTDKKEDV